jgi:hypothetical protein
MWKQHPPTVVVGCCSVVHVLNLKNFVGCRNKLKVGARALAVTKYTPLPLVGRSAKKIYLLLAAPTGGRFKKDIQVLLLFLFRCAYVGVGVVGWGWGGGGANHLDYHSLITLAVKLSTMQVLFSRTLI